MGLLRGILGAEAAFLAVALCAACVWQILRRRGLAGLLGRRDVSGRWVVDPLRCQVSLVTLAVALFYLRQSLSDAGNPAMPAAPWPVLILLALSQAAWLRGEARRLGRRYEDMRR